MGRQAQLRPAKAEDDDDNVLLTVTGRPARKSAARKSVREGFVDSQDAHLDVSDSSEYDEECPKKKWTQKPIANPRALSPVQDHDFPDSSLEDSPQPSKPASNQVAAPPLPDNVSLTFHVPKNHTGPFVVNLNLRDLGMGQPQHTVRQTNTKRTKLSKQTKAPEGKAGGQHMGFNDLPPEIRNIIYRELFGSRKDLNFARPDFSLSGQFLRSNKQILVEAAPVLYGTHSFRLCRDNNVTGVYWKKPWTTVGYRNVRRWLTDIGPLNVSFLRDVEFEFDDGNPNMFVNPSSSESYYRTASLAKEEARYVHDSDLIACVKILARYGQLRKLTLDFDGRKTLSRRDDRFVHELRKVRADTLVDKGATQHYYFHGRRISKIEGDLLNDLRKKVQRQPKLYKQDKKEVKGNEKKGKQVHMTETDLSDN